MKAGRTGFGAFCLAVGTAALVAARDAVPSPPAPLAWHPGSSTGADGFPVDFGTNGWLSLDLAPPVAPQRWTSPGAEPAGRWRLLAWIPAAGECHLRLMDTDPVPGRPVANGGLRRDDALESPPEAVWEGFVPETGSRWFRVVLGARQALWAEVVAGRLGTRLDPYMRVLDDSGREVASADDVPGWQTDAVVGIEAPHAGSYWIELRDTRHEGGPEHRFRLRLTPGAPSRSPWRLAGLPSPGSTASARPAEEVGILGAGTRIRAGFSQPQQTNRHLLRGKAGEGVAVRFSSRTTGSFIDPLARLEDPEGRVLAVLDPAANHGEGALTHRFGSDGAASLVVWEAAGIGGAEAGYELEVAGTDRLLDLDVEPAVATVSPGETAELKLRIRRKGHKLPARIRLEGAPEGSGLSETGIPGDRQEITTRLEVPADAVAPALWLVEIKGSAGDDSGGPDIESAADATDGWRRVWPELLHPPAPLARRILLVVRPRQDRP